MGYKLNGADLLLGKAFRDSNGTNYPSNWLTNSTDSDRSAVPTGGITWVSDVFKDYEYYENGDPSKPKDLAAKKASLIKEDKEQAKSLLGPTDLAVVRKAEKGTAISSDVQTTRDNIRSAQVAREATINACANIETLEKTMRDKLAPTVAGTGSNGATEKKKDDGSSYDPVQYNDIANPDKLEEWPS